MLEFSSSWSKGRRHLVVVVVPYSYSDKVSLPSAATSTEYCRSTLWRTLPGTFRCESGRSPAKAACWHWPLSRGALGWSVLDVSQGMGQVSGSLTKCVTRATDARTLLRNTALRRHQDGASGHDSVYNLNAHKPRSIGLCLVPSGVPFQQRSPSPRCPWMSLRFRWTIPTQPEATASATATATHSR